MRNKSRDVSHRPIRIAHLVVELDVGGTEVMLSRVIRRLDPRRFTSTLISLLPGGQIESDLRRSGVPVICIGARRGIPDPRSIYRLCEILSRERIDLLQCYSYAPNILGLLAAKAVGIPAIWSLRCSKVDFSHYSRSAAFSFHLNRVLSRYADLIIANSDAGGQYHRACGYSGARMIMVPNGFELDRYRIDHGARKKLREELGVEDGTVLIGHVARFDPIKDHRTFVSASGRVCAARPSTRVVMVGRGVTNDNPTLTGWLAREGLGGKAFLLGQRTDVERIMAGLDFLVSSSEDEGFPNVIAEAMACGIPCVVTNAGDSALIVGETGLVVPAQDPRALSAAMEQMLDYGSKVREERGQAARRQIETRFEISVVVKNFENVYDRLFSPDGV
jgi:glycosyltransferase involved in cell wall biosynthesis